MEERDGNTLRASSAHVPRWRSLRAGLGEGERVVAVMKAPAPQGWRLSVDDGAPCYVNDAIDAVATIMSSVDDHTRIWDHAFIALPAPVDHETLLDCIATFFD